RRMGFSPACSMSCRCSGVRPVMLMVILRMRLYQTRIVAQGVCSDDADCCDAPSPDSRRSEQLPVRAASPGARDWVGFPLVRIVAIISLATGLVRDLALGPYKGKEMGETAFFRPPPAMASSCLNSYRR